MTVLSLLPPPLADIALTHSLHHDRFIEFMAISVIESIKLILRGTGVAFKMGVVLEVGVVRLREKKSPPFQRIPLCSEMTATIDPSDLGAWPRMYKITLKPF